MCFIPLDVKFPLIPLLISSISPSFLILTWSDNSCTKSLSTSLLSMHSKLCHTSSNAPWVVLRSPSHVYLIDGDVMTSHPWPIDTSLVSVHVFKLDVTSQDVFTASFLIPLKKLFHVFFCRFCLNLRLQFASMGSKVYAPFSFFASCLSLVI